MPSHRLHRLRPPVLVLCAALLAGACRDEGTGESAGGGAGAGAGGSAATSVKTLRVELREFADEIEALGTVRAMEAAEISATAIERVAEVHFEDGDTARKGELLVKLDDAEEVAILNGAKAMLAEQEREIARLESLVSTGSVAEVRLEEYRTRREVARQKVAEAQAQIDDRRIVAPFDGVLGFRQVSVGALVSPGDPIATLDVLDPVKIDLAVPETFLSDLDPGDEIVVLTEAYPGESFPATISQIDTRVNPTTRSITVRAESPNPDHRLRPGMLMTTVLRKNPRRSPAVPERAVVSLRADHFVFVLDEGTGTVSRTKVLLGQRLPGYVEVVERVAEGAVVVTDGLLGLADGAAVSVQGEFDGPAAPYRPAAVGR